MTGIIIKLAGRPVGSLGLIQQAQCTFSTDIAKSEECQNSKPTGSLCLIDSNHNCCRLSYLKENKLPVGTVVATLQNTD